VVPLPAMPLPHMRGIVVTVLVLLHLCAPRHHEDAVAQVQHLDG
jgi:hypothetical protein